MENLIIDSTKSTPNVEFNNNGELSIKGRAYSEDPRKFFEPLLNWVRELDTDTVKVEIKLEYLNTSSTKMMNEFIKTIDANTKIHSKLVKWYFEEDDEDMLEAGQIFEENTFSTDFFFHGLAEVA